MKRLFFLWLHCLCGCTLVHGFLQAPASHRSLPTELHLATSREQEIRRKILALKREGRLKPSESNNKQPDDYSQKIRNKLGKTKSKYLGFTSEEDELAAIEKELEEDEEETTVQGRIGSLQSPETPKTPATKTQFNILDPSLFENDEDDREEEEMSEKELVELVQAKLMEKQQKIQIEREAKIKEDAQRKLREIAEQRKQETSSGSTKQTTSGVGGSWDPNSANTEDKKNYTPKVGTWGAFPRPRDISKAYGGGRRIGPGFSDEEARERSKQETRERLRQYRQKVGIEVQSEKDHAAEIEEALAIGQRAMQRGIYETAVSALEKVTRYCSTNSKVGGNVFLELAMAYEACGRTEEAIAVYSTLTTCRIEEIKFNAKRLLYGIEAMNFMRNEARSEAFSRKKIRNTFIDTTGLANIADNFDDVYQTAYIDLDSGFYKRLTSSVVRSNREARQILLKARGKGEVDRLKIVQALRSLARNFDTALEAEIESNKPEKEPVAVMNGKPILQRPKKEIGNVVGMDEFVLASPDQMMENLNGEWKLQLLADKRGDGVSYYNTTSAWQKFRTNDMTFDSSGPAGFMTVSQGGSMTFDPKRRILRRTNVQTSGGVFPGLFMGKGGATAAVATPQQIISVDSILLITRCVGREASESEKDHFAVWRKRSKK